METFSEIWQTLQTNLKPGTSLRNWTVLKGYFGKDIVVTKITGKTIHFKSATAQNIQVVSKDDFEKFWKIWRNYKRQKIKRSEIRALTRFSRYIINTYRWLETER